MKWTAIILLLPAAGLWGETKITELKLRVDPAEARVRPFETVMVQVLVYGTAGERKGRLQSANWQIRLREEGGGWLSKPFKFQGQDSEAFVEEQESSLLSIINRGVGQFTIKDAVLYTAPEKAGRYTVEVTSGSLRAETAIEVTAEAASRLTAEKTSFGPETPAADPYRGLAEYYAPFVAQETWFQPKSDFLARFDYDGDWQGNNNWEHLDTGSSQAYVHYAVMATGTHWFVLYNFFHPRDYSDKCVVGTCHENDNEGMILTIRKDGSAFGKVEVLETLAHDNIYSYTNEASIRNGIHDIDGRIDLWEGSHPMIFIEAGGHGVHAVSDAKSLFSAAKMDFIKNTGVTYAYRGSAQRPRHAQDRLVAYDLLPIWDQWWTKSMLGASWAQPTFDDFYNYEPAGNRPRMRNNLVGGSFYGRQHAENKAKPFWGWHDLRTQRAKVLSRGQWALDPAYAVSLNLKFPPNLPVSLDYTFNPYLDVAGGPEPVRVTSADPVALPAPARARPALPSSPAPETLAPKAKEGTCEWEARVDGSVVVTLRGDQAEYQELSGQPVAGGTLRCTAGLPGLAAEVEVEKKAGRGSVRLVETPSESNGFVARIQVDDPKGGSDRYRVVVRWKR
jgi:hypothetical protein